MLRHRRVTELSVPPLNRERRPRNRLARDHCTVLGLHRAYGGIRRARRFRGNDQLYREPEAAGVDVILDDRDERPGVMFADMELIGIPIAWWSANGAWEGQIELEYKAGETINHHDPAGESPPCCKKLRAPPDHSDSAWRSVAIAGAKI